jgi:hypothetical protein
MVFCRLWPAAGSPLAKSPLREVSNRPDYRRLVRKRPSTDPCQPKTVTSVRLTTVLEGTVAVLVRPPELHQVATVKKSSAPAGAIPNVLEVRIVFDALFLVGNGRLRFGYVVADHDGNVATPH